MAGTSWDALTPRMTDALLGTASTRRLRRGAWLYHEGDASDQAYLVTGGLMKLVKTAADGTQALLALRGPGDFVGEHTAIDGLPRFTGVMAVVSSEVAGVHRDLLRELLRAEPDLALNMLTAMSGQLRAATLHILDLASGDASMLVARRLCQLATDETFEAVRSERRGSIVVDMPVAQEQLAAWAGVSHRSAAAALRRLRDDGIISTSRLQLEVHDLAQLQDQATGA